MTAYGEMEMEMKLTVQLAKTLGGLHGRRVWSAQCSESAAQVVSERTQICCKTWSACLACDVTLPSFNPVALAQNAPTSFAPSVCEPSGVINSETEKRTPLHKYRPITSSTSGTCFENSAAILSTARERHFSSRSKCQKFTTTPFSQPPAPPWTSKPPSPLIRRARRYLISFASLWAPRPRNSQLSRLACKSFTCNAEMGRLSFESKRICRSFYCRGRKKTCQLVCMDRFHGSMRRLY